MARPFKSGVDYFPLDVVMDDKIKLIQAEHGIVGFGIVIKLYQKVYADSYWITWDKKASLVFSSENKVDINEVTAIINSCFEWDVFNQKLFDKYKILTSNGIQKRYFKIVERRELVEIVKEFLLVKEPEWDSILIVTANSNSINDSSSTQSKVKERKRKVFIYPESFDRWFETYPKRNGRRVGKKAAFNQFEKIDKSDWKNLKIATGNYSKECGDLPKDPERFLKNDFWCDYIGQKKKESALKAVVY